MPARFPRFRLPPRHDLAPWIVGPLIATSLVAVPGPAGGGVPGSLDPAFGTSGVVVVPIDLGGDLLDITRASVLQQDGNLLLAGGARVATDLDSVLVRLTPSGAPDPTFGANGILHLAVANGGDGDVAEDLVLLPDGRILTAIERTPSAAGSIDTLLVQLEPSGTFDAGFANNGLVAVPLPSGYAQVSLEMMRRQPDGKIVLLRAVQAAAGDIDMMVTRVDADGNLDSTFSNDGHVNLFFDLGGSNRDHPYAVALQHDGKIVVVGSVSVSATDTDMAVVRLETDGSPDLGFGGNGRQIIPFDLGGEVDRAASVAVQADGKIVVAGEADTDPMSSDRLIAIARLRVDGTLDPTLAGTGKVAFSFRPGDTHNVTWTIVPLASGRLLVGGEVGDASFDLDYAVTRLQPNGSIDTSFGTNGTAAIDFALGPDSLDGLTDLAVRPDGSILLSGAIQRASGGDFDLAVAQLLGDPDAPALFGDGFESGTTGAWTTTVP